VLWKHLWNRRASRRYCCRRHHRHECAQFGLGRVVLSVGRSRLGLVGRLAFKLRLGWWVIWRKLGWQLWLEWRQLKWQLGVVGGQPRQPEGGAAKGAARSAARVVRWFVRRKLWVIGWELRLNRWFQRLVGRQLGLERRLMPHAGPMVRELPLKKATLARLPPGRPHLVVRFILCGLLTEGLCDVRAQLDSQRRSADEPDRDGRQRHDDAAAVAA
jgi:hypothetical protein